MAPAKEDPTGEDATDCAFQLVNHPPPAWSRLVWESQASALPISLDEPELVALQRTYADLAAITD
jgi:hypothetical protein